MFLGRWIIEPDDHNRWTPHRDADAAFGLAQHCHGALIFYHHHVGDAWAPSLILYPDLNAAAHDLDLDQRA